MCVSGSVGSDREQGWAPLVHLHRAAHRPRLQGTANQSSYTLVYQKDTLSDDMNVLNIVTVYGCRKKCSSSEYRSYFSIVQKELLYNILSQGVH
jgi:hypothetical protein